MIDIENCCVNTEVNVFGKITKIRKLGGIVFVVIKNQWGDCQVTFEKDKFTFLKGDFISVNGVIKEWASVKEIYVLDSKLVGDSNLRISPNDSNFKKIDKLIFKSEVMREMTQFLLLKNFLPVSSPTIVGNWVEGKTNSFEVDYYGTKKYLTLNSMLYHQVMLISGYNKIFEFSKIFRQDNSSPKDRLSEFISLDISMSYSNKFDMMQLIEDMICYIFHKLKNNINVNINIIQPFEKISYQDLLNKLGCRSIDGAQLNSVARRYLNDNYDSFVWVYGFPEEKRRFFVKSTQGVCDDYQLWYKGKHQVASGGERETNLDIMKEKMIQEGKDENNYSDILSSFESGVPSMCEIGFGLDRFLLDITNNNEISDFVAFPRNGNTNF